MCEFKTGKCNRRQGKRRIITEFRGLCKLIVCKTKLYYLEVCGVQLNNLHLYWDAAPAWVLAARALVLQVNVYWYLDINPLKLIKDGALGLDYNIRSESIKSYFVSIIFALYWRFFFSFETFAFCYFFPFHLDYSISKAIFYCLSFPPENFKVLFLKSFTDSLTCIMLSLKMSSKTS